MEVLDARSREKELQEFRAKQELQERLERDKRESELKLLEEKCRAELELTEKKLEMEKTAKSTHAKLPQVEDYTIQRHRSRLGALREHVSDTSSR